MEKVFVRSGHFLFEFIQNTDDAEANSVVTNIKLPVSSNIIMPAC